MTWGILCNSSCWRKDLVLKDHLCPGTQGFRISPSAIRNLSYVSQTCIEGENVDLRLYSGREHGCGVVLRDRIWIWDGIEGGREHGFEVQTTVSRWPGLIPCSHNSAAPLWHKEASLGPIQSQKPFPPKKFPDFYKTWP